MCGIIGYVGPRECKALLIQGLEREGSGVRRCQTGSRAVQLRQGIVLEIVEQKDNPNYYFAGYQQVGDKYNLPNPAMHPPAKWPKVVKRMVARRDVDCSSLGRRFAS